MKNDAGPVCLGPLNAAATTGLPWRWLRDRAAAAGVLRRAGRKSWIDITDLPLVLEAAPGRAERDAGTERRDVERRLGLRRTANAWS